MLFDVSDILQETGSFLEFNHNVKVGNIAYQGDSIRFDGPINARGKVINGGDLIHLNAHLDGKATMECDICRTRYEYPVDFDIEVGLKASVDEDEPDLYVYSNNVVDLGDIIAREFLLRLPIQRRCSKECKGLCPTCGLNLNLEKCNCEDRDSGDIDLRMADLKELLADMDREV